MDAFSSLSFYSQDLTKMIAEFGGMNSFNESVIDEKKKSINNPQHVKNEIPLNTSFKLPIQYLKKEEIHKLSPSVIEDLELISVKNGGEEKNIYNFLFDKKTEYGERLFENLSKFYTTNVPFLKDTQQVIEKIEIKDISSSSIPCMSSYSNMCTVWKSLKNDKDFYDRYGFVDWEILKYLNTQTAFLEYMSIMNILSPLTTLLVPIIILVIPFLILKIKGIPISFNSYIETIIEIGKNHFIGKMVLSLKKEISIYKIGYLFMTMFFFFLQLYQNINSGIKYYESIKRVNEELIQMKTFIDESIYSMESFVEKNKELTTYVDFCKTTTEKCAVLHKIKNELVNIYPFNVSLSKVQLLGYMLKTYFVLHDSIEYEDAILYSIDMKGYFECLTEIKKNVLSGAVTFGEIKEDRATKLRIRGQFYPAHKHGKYVANDCILDKNIIITGVNASGKTTFLKSTLINIILTQQYGVGFYKKCVICPYTHIHSYLNIPDTMERDSLFQAEARRCKDILDSIKMTSKDNSRHFCIFDELYSGTNPVEATKTSFAFLSYLCGFKNVNFVLTTHYNSICQMQKKEPNIKNYKTIVTRNKLTDELVYTYRVAKGICKMHGAKDVLKKMGYCDEILKKL